MYSSILPSSIGLNVSDITFLNSSIMDLGATYHMTYTPSVFCTYSPWNKKVAIADGSLTTVAGVVNVKNKSIFNL